jgi:hypothetical protein
MTGPTLWIRLKMGSNHVEMTAGVAMIVIGSVGSVVCWLWRHFGR